MHTRQLRRVKPSTMGDLCVVGGGGFEYPGGHATWWTNGWGDALVDLARLAGVRPSLQLACFADGDELERPGEPSLPIRGSARSAFDRFIARAKRAGRRRTLRRLGFDVADVELDEVEVAFTGRVMCRLDGPALATLAAHVARRLPVVARPSFPPARWRRACADSDLVAGLLVRLATLKRWESHLALAVLAHVSQKGLKKLGLEEDEPSWEDVL